MQVYHHWAWHLNRKEDLMEELRVMGLSFAPNITKKVYTCVQRRTNEKKLVLLEKISSNRQWQILVCLIVHRMLYQPNP